MKEKTDLELTLPVQQREYQQAAGLELAFRECR